MSRSITLFLLLLALLSLTTPTWATVIYVSGDQTGTWSADTVIVTGEVRVPPGQNLTILPGVEVLFSVYCKLIVDNGATLRAVGTATDSIRFDVLPPDTAWHGIRFLSASDSSRVEYCHLTHGKATGSHEDLKGGAIYCSSASPTVRHCLIDNCSTSWTGRGGGIYCGNNSSPIISQNIICGNVAFNGGGGIYCSGSSPTISNNTISGNGTSEGSAGGGIYCTDNSNPTILCNTISENGTSYGCGIYCLSSSPTISGNTISDNLGTGNLPACGGGIYCYNSSPTISGNTISGNLPYGYGGGGGIYCEHNSSPTISGNIISNSACGGISCWAGNPLLIGNTIFGNIALLGVGGGIWGSPGTTIINCIL